MAVDAAKCPVSPGSGPVCWVGRLPTTRAKDREGQVARRPRSPVGGDQQAEVDRLICLGATPVDIGQGAVSWVVLADPDGNEFCVLDA